MCTDSTTKKKAKFLSFDFKSKQGSDDSHCHFGEARSGGSAMTWLGLG